MRGQGAWVGHGMVRAARDNSAGAEVAVSTNSSVSVHRVSRRGEHLLGVDGAVSGPG